MRRSELCLSFVHGFTGRIAKTRHALLKVAPKGSGITFEAETEFILGVAVLSVAKGHEAASETQISRVFLTRTGATSASPKDGAYLSR